MKTLPQREGSAPSPAAALPPEPCRSRAQPTAHTQRPVVMVTGLDLSDQNILVS